MKGQRFGGSFAPPLSDELLHTYRGLIDAVPEKTELRDALDALYTCATTWWDLPESWADTPMEATSRPHPSGSGTIIDLSPDIALALWEHIPWSKDLAAIGVLLEQDPLTAATPETAPLRNAAFHLLWHVKELDLDREPITSDKL